MKFIALFLMLFSCLACSQTSSVDLKANSPTKSKTSSSSKYVWYLTGDNLAVQGRDVVAYFSLSSRANAVEGKKQFTYEWEGAKWQFSSQANLDTFKASPEKYIPQYGGYCAFAAARDYLFKIDPNAWAIKDEKLYLNASKGVRISWLKNVDTEIKKANKNWPKLRRQAK